jgi:hypothetical protein
MLQEVRSLPLTPILLSLPPRFRNTIPRRLGGDHSPPTTSQRQSHQPEVCGRGLASPLAIFVLLSSCVHPSPCCLCRFVQSGAPPDAETCARVCPLCQTYLCPIAFRGSKCIDQQQQVRFVHDALLNKGCRVALTHHPAWCSSRLLRPHFVESSLRTSRQDSF